MGSGGGSGSTPNDSRAQRHSSTTTRMRAVALGLAIALSGCTAADVRAQSASNLGTYRQVSYRDTTAMAYHVLPRYIRVEERGQYEMEIINPATMESTLRLRSTYRIVGDSIFFDRTLGGSSVVELIAKRVGDTLFVRVPGIAQVSDGEIREPIRFVRSRRQ